MARNTPQYQHRKQARALRLLASGTSLEETATRLAVRVATLVRWCAEPAFAEMLDSLRRAHAAQAASAVAGDTTAPAAVRLEAARLVLQY